MILAQSAENQHLSFRLAISYRPISACRRDTPTREGALHAYAAFAHYSTTLPGIILLLALDGLVRRGPVGGCRNVIE